MVKRDIRLDTIKGLLIILVVMGHMLDQVGKNQYAWIFYNWIYTFHMPLFILITGYFTNTSHTPKKYFKGVLNLFSVFILFSILHHIINKNFHFGFNSLIYYTVWTMWYLLTVCYYRIIAYITKKYNKKEVMLFFWFIVVLLSGFCPLEGEMSIQRTLAYSLFFFGGLYLRENKLMNRLYSTPRIIAITIFVSWVLFLVFKLNGNYTYIINGKCSYYSWHFPSLLSVVVRLCFTVLAVSASISVVRLLKANKILTLIGEQSLFIYIYHSFFIQFFKKLFPDTICSNFTTFILLSFFVALSLLILYRMKIFKELLSPIYSVERLFKR